MTGKAAIGLVKPYVGPILTTVVQQIIESGGGDARCGCLLWESKRSDGNPTIMARVYRLNELDEPGEELATIDVLRAAESMDLSKFIQE